MTPLEIIKQAEGMELRDEDGHVTTLKLEPPLTDDQLHALESSLPCPLPAEARELLAYSCGVEGILESVAFCGLDWSHALEEIFPHGIPIAHDGYGNVWVVDLTSDSTSWGPIFFACHDPSVIVFQTESLAHFISELLRFGNPPWQSEIDDVHEQYTDRIWADNPGVLTHAHCLASGDADLEAFARSLEEDWEFIDLRQPRLGDGFSWGRYGAETPNRRFGEKRLFAYKYQPRKTLWDRLRGR